MFRIALKGILARKRRLLMTSLIIVIGVAFISGTAVLSDLLTRSVNDLVAEAFKNIDVVVRSSSSEQNPFSSQPVHKPVPADVLSLVRGAKGVRAAEGMIESQPQMLDKQGKALSAFGPPVQATNYLGHSPLALGTITSGRGPRAPDEAALDAKTAKDLGFEIGDNLTLQFKGGGATFRIVGLGGLGENGQDSSGTKNVQLQTARLQQLTGLQGQYSYVTVAAKPGVSQDELRATIRPLLPSGVEALTGQEYISERQAEIGQLLHNVELLVSLFGYLAAFVAVFVIYNIFSIIIAQRTRELALLRAVGGSRAQILGSVLLEALVVGVIAAVLGLAIGYVLAAVLKGALGSFITIASGPPHLTTAAIVRSLVVGVVATMISAIIPAVRATRIPPVAAMSETALETSPLSLTRKVLGAAFLAIAGASIGYAVQPDASNGLRFLGVGSVLLFVSLVMLGPLFAGPISRFIGRPLPSLRGAPGRIARDNAARNPKRTTATGIALTIGVAVVTVIAVLASSFKFSLTHSFETQIKGDLIVSAGFGGGGFDPTLADKVKAVPGVDTLTQLRFGTGCSLDSTKGKAAATTPPSPTDTNSTTCRAGTDAVARGGETIFLVGVDPATFFKLIDVGTVKPSQDTLGDNGIAVQDTVLQQNNWHIGQKVRMWFGQVGQQDFTVDATYSKPFGGGGSDQYVVNLPTFDRVSNPVFLLTNSMYIKVAPGSDVGQVQREIEKVVQPIAPAAQVQNISTFVRDQTKQLQGFLNIIYVLLLLAVIVAVFGISITMSLSVYERTRELGLLRAIGMERRQMRTSVRWEAAVISLFGTMLGLATGVLLSIALVYGFRNDGISLDLPWVIIIVIAIGGAIAGLLAARRPAKRAAGLDILDAIATV
jgi:putative ABC transport system permease protein